MKPGISTTQSRPSVSQSIATGSWTRGSLATSSTPVARRHVERLSASSGESGGDSLETFCTPGGQARFAGELCETIRARHRQRRQTENQPQTSA